ncbi:MAG TPA: hypothetical protein VLE53_18225 [Gemmatimonadaceae bacterium]|nr:hypothetical protein [Gemmatimonadaceae bacterium]
MQTAPVQPVQSVTDWGDSLRASLTNALAIFFAAIPRIIAFLVIVLVGWFIASLLAKGVSALLRAANFNDIARRSGFSGFVQNMGVRTDASEAIATVVRWFVRLIALVVAFDALGLPAVSDVLRQLLLWLPNLVVALVVLVIGGLAAGALSNLVRGATAQAGFNNPDLIATIAKVAVWAFAIVVAVNQLGIATTLTNTLFMGVIGAIALALGLSFGLGGRDTAARLVERWYASGPEGARKMAEAARAARGQARAGQFASEPIPRSAMRADEPPPNE